MFRNVLGGLVTGPVRVLRPGKGAPSAGRVRRFADGKKDEALQPPDASLLQVLVCPLSKKPLRYEAATNELINEELGIAYSIIDGIPNMIPQEARLVQKDEDPSATPADPSKQA